MLRSNSGFEHEYSEGVLYVRLWGEIDHHGAATLRGDIDSLIYEKRPQRLLLICREWALWTARGSG